MSTVQNDKPTNCENDFPKHHFIEPSHNFNKEIDSIKKKYKSIKNWSNKNQNLKQEIDFLQQQLDFEKVKTTSLQREANFFHDQARKLEEMVKIKSEFFEMQLNSIQFEYTSKIEKLKKDHKRKIEEIQSEQQKKSKISCEDNSLCNFF